MKKLFLKKFADRDWTVWLSDIKNYIYICFIFTVYVLVLHNHYYDITKTRYTWFMGISSAFIVTSVFYGILVYTLRKRRIKEDIRRTVKTPPVIFAALFLLANIISCNSMHAFYGDNGRFMGLAMYLVLCLVVIILSVEFRGFDSLYIIFAVTVLFMLVLALVQHTGVDVFSLKGGIKSNQYDKFISTIGNINIFASFIVIATGVAFGAYAYGPGEGAGFVKRLVFKLLYAIVLFACGMTIMTANSDSAYLGLGVIILVGIFTGLFNGRLSEIFSAAVIFFAGNLVMAFWHTKMDSYPNYGGLAHKLDNVKVALAAVLAFVLLYMVAFFGKKYAEKREGAKDRKKLLVIAFSAAVVIAGAAFVVYGIKSGDSIFKFDYKWGTYRGYIWSKCWETFKDAPLLKKLFGYGNESIKQAVTVPNYNDMVAKTNRIYDNAHNEVLQYLITLGLFGALSYIALVVSAVWYMCKHGAKTMHTYIPVFVVCGYFVQGLVNLNQPITTPLFFVILGMGVGYARACRNIE